MKRKLVSKVIAIALAFSLLPAYSPLLAFAEEGESQILEQNFNLEEPEALVQNFDALEQNEGSIMPMVVEDNDSTIVIHYRSTKGGDVSNDKDQFREMEPMLEGSTAMPEPEYHFVGWYDKDDNLVSRELTFVPEMPEGGWKTAHYTAAFEVGPLSITTNVIGGTIDPSIDVGSGTNCTINYAPNEGFILKSVVVDGIPVDETVNASSYTFFNVQKDHNISVTYVNIGISGTDFTGTYDGVAHAANIAMTGLDQGQFKIEFSTDGGKNWTGMIPSITNVGILQVMARVVSNDVEDTKIYATKNIQMQIIPATAVINVNNAQKTYGTADPAFTGSVSGLINPADLGVITYGRIPGEGVGIYTITAGYTPNNNYNVIVNNGVFAILTGAVIPPAGPPTTPPAGPPTTPPTIAPLAPAGEVLIDEALEEEAEEIVEEAAPEAAEKVTKEKAAKADVKQWALINLLSAIFTVVMIGLLALSDKKKTEFAAGLYGSKQTRGKFKVGIVVEVVIAVAAAITFILTENMKYDMIMADNWTLLMLAFAVGSIVTYIAVGKRTNNEQDIVTES